MAPLSISIPGDDTDRVATVPNLGGFASATYHFDYGKISFGYRGNFFCDAIDGGIDKRKSETLGAFGPHANVTIGFCG